MRWGLFFVLALAGCASETATVAPLDRSDLDLDACTAGPSRVEALSPSEPVDYLELRGGFGSIERAGALCSGATDRAACEDAFANLLPPGPWTTGTDGGAPAPGEYIVYTRGDEVGAVGESAIASFLAPVDDPAEAAFLGAIATKGRVDCEGPSAVQVEGGFELLMIRTETCGGAVSEHRVFVGADGSTEIVERALIREGDDIVCP